MEPSKDEPAVMLRYGYRVVWAGIGALVLIFGLTLARPEVAAAVGSVSAAIAGIAGAFFGVHVGSAGKARTEAARDKAEEDRHQEALKVQRLLAELVAEEHREAVNHILH
jgi:hypothetical protein